MNDKNEKARSKEQTRVIRGMDEDRSGAIQNWGVVKCENCAYFNTEAVEFSMPFEFEHVWDETFEDGRPMPCIIEGKSTWPIRACNHPVCFKNETKYSMVSGKIIEKKRVAGQAQLNTKGNCEYYKRKWWKFWLDV